MVVVGTSAAAAPVATGSPEERVRAALPADFEGDPIAEAVRIITAWRQQHEAPGQRVYDVSFIGGRIRCAREIAGLTQRQLALRWNETRFFVARVEKGHQALPVRKVPGLAMILGVSRDWLLMESDEGGPQARHLLLRKEKSESLTRLKRRQAEWKRAQEHAKMLTAARKGVDSVGKSTE